MKKSIAFAFATLLFAAGCQPPNQKVVDHLPPPTPEPLVQAPGRLLGRYNLPPPKPQYDRPPVFESTERSWTPPGGFSSCWQYVVIHHSGDERSTPAGIDAWHRQRGWDEMGYHFVIGNGVGYGDGQVFVGPRWPKQKHGAHVRVNKNDDNRWNLHGIGICLIGNLDHHAPTPKQVASLTRLVTFLCERCHIPLDHITTHGNISGTTECPGRQMPLAQVRQRVAAARRNGPVHAFSN